MIVVTIIGANGIGVTPFFKEFTRWRNPEVNLRIR